MRPTYNEKYAKIGRIGEKLVAEFLSKKKFNFDWRNRYHESLDSPDFIILNKGKMVAGIEVEVKDSKHKDCLTFGIHFIKDKVNKLSKLKIPVFYYLVLSDKSGIYYIKVKDIKKYGTIICKNNIRMNNEEFYEVPERLCKFIELKDIENDKRNSATEQESWQHFFTKSN